MVSVTWGTHEMAEDGGGAPSGALPDLVAQCYYRYGLLVATHPKKVIFLAFTSFLIVWYVPFSPSNNIWFIYNDIFKSTVHLMSIHVKEKWYVQLHQLVLRCCFSPYQHPFVAPAPPRLPAPGVCHVTLQLQCASPCSWGRHPSGPLPNPSPSVVPGATPCLHSAGEKNTGLGVRTVPLCIGNEYSHLNCTISFILIIWKKNIG